MREIVALIFLVVGLVVAVSKLGVVPERWVAFVVLVALTFNWWIPRFLTRGTSEPRVSLALPILGGVIAIGGAILLFLNYGWAPAIAVVVLCFGYIFIAQWRHQQRRLAGWAPRRSGLFVTLFARKAIMAGLRRVKGTAMVQRVQSFDDFDGSPAVETVRYGYAGREYEIDLNEEHAREFDELLAPYLERSRKVEPVAEVQPQPRQRRARRGGGERRPPEELQAIRQWARAQGYPVSDRGRIKADILAKYGAAH